MITVIDYGAGNLRSVTNALGKLGVQVKVTGEPNDVLGAEAVIFPGVGAAANVMGSLRRSGLDTAIRQVISRGSPFLAVCIGMQVLFSSTEEDGGQKCLGIVRGQVRRLPLRPKVPHIGWNQVEQRLGHPIFDGIEDEENFYFVHSYYVKPGSGRGVAGITEYGVPILSVLARDNLVATQFHPERSGAPGLRMYQNFLRMAGVMQKTRTLEQKAIGYQERAAQLVDRYEGRPENLYSILCDIQSECRFLPEDAVKEVARRMGLPLMQVYRVAAFYSEFCLEPSRKI